MHEEELVRQLMSKTPDTRRNSWDHLYKSIYPMIREMVLKNSGTEDDVVDVLHDGLVTLFCNLREGTYRNESKITTYLFGICRNLWHQEHRRKQRQVVAEHEAILELRQDWNQMLNIEVVSLLMRELGEDCKRILTEYYFNNRSMSELKDIFNVNSVQAAKNKKWRCMNYLVKLFKEKGVTPTWV